MEDFLKNFADAIDGVKVEDLKPGTDYKNDLKQWDSLAVMTILAMVDSKYNVIISGDDIEDAETIQDLYNQIKQNM